MVDAGASGAAGHVVNPGGAAVAAVDAGRPAGLVKRPCMAVAFFSAGAGGFAAGTGRVVPSSLPWWLLRLLLLQSRGSRQPTEPFGTKWVPRMVAFPIAEEFGGGRLVGLVDDDTFLCRIGLAAPAAPDCVPTPCHKTVKTVAFKTPHRLTLVGHR